MATRGRQMSMIENFKRMEFRTKLALGLAMVGVVIFIYGFTGQQEFRLVRDGDLYKGLIFSFLFCFCFVFVFWVVFCWGG